MSLFAKIMVVVNFILAVAFLAAAGTLLGAAEDYKAKYEKAGSDARDRQADLEKQVSDRDNRLTATSKNLADTITAKAAVDAQLATLSKANDTVFEANRQIRGDLDKLTNAQTDLQGKLADLNKQLDAVRNDLAAARASNNESEAKNRAQADEIARLTQDKKTAEDQLAAAETAMKSITGQLDEKTTLLARYKQEAGPLKGGLAMKDVHGVVNAVDNAVDIYVLSVGSKDNVAVGYEFTIYRGSEYISTIVIDKVFPNYSSGMTKPGTKRKPVQAGDEAATRL